ncbi:hypothetical protein DF3PB_3800005 [uncultured Defluviicoccus sp.]|nr:hypothetical protein DF3PB_3800005 [uncultured Defluviicoccus sp.]
MRDLNERLRGSDVIEPPPFLPPPVPRGHR